MPLQASHFARTDGGARRPRRLLLAPAGVLLALLGSAGPGLGQAGSQKPATVPVESYVRILEGVVGRLEREEAGGKRRLRPVLNPLTVPRVVRRKDGATLTVGPDLWVRLGPAFIPAAKPGPPPPNPPATPLVEATPEEWARARSMARKQLAALRAWAVPEGGRYYQPADAQSIVGQLEASGQIKTKLSPAENWLMDAMTWLRDQFQAFMDWIGSLLPKTPTTQTPDWNLEWMWKALWGLVLFALGYMIYFLYRMLGGRLNRNRPRNEEYLDNADAELLLLPPDELRLRAENFAAQGNYAQAVRHRYVSLLLTLDSRGVWRYDVRRTNWEHIAGLRKEAERRPLIAPLSALTRLFDRVRYGDAACSAEEWYSFATNCDALEGRKDVAHREVAA